MATGNLIPNLDKYFDKELNVMLIGPHGQGKTFSIMQFAKEHEIKLHYISAALIDPWTDLVGIPTPRRYCGKCEDWYPIEMRECPFHHSRLGKETLVNIRPHAIDEAELIFVDEFNRGVPKTLNAIFELVQFRSINGERLPKLKAVWTAINPPDSGQYQVEDLDPALVDRFDVYININPAPSFGYMIDQGFRRDTTQAVLAWHKGMDKDRRAADQIKHHISNRRLEKMIRVHELTGDINLAIPPWIDVEKNKLADMLAKAARQAQERSKIFSGGKLGEGAYTGFEYTAEWLEGNTANVVDYLQKHVEDIDTNHAIVQALAPKHGKTLAKLSYLDLMENMNQTVVEGMIDAMGDMKRNSFFQGLDEVVDAKWGEYPHLIKHKDEFFASFEGNEEADTSEAA